MPIILLQAQASRGVQGHGPLGKIGRYVPLKCHFLHLEITVKGKYLARKSLKNWENIKQNREARNIRRKGRFLAKTGGLESLQIAKFYLLIN